MAQAIGERAPRDAAAPARPLVRNCSVDRTLAILSDAWSFLVLREFYLGARRFAQIRAALGIPRSTLSDRLNRLSQAGIIERRAQAPGATRTDYRLSARGLDLYVVMLAMLRFGDDWLSDGAAPPLTLIHAACGHACRPLSVCGACAAPIAAVRVAWRDGPGAGRSPAADLPQRRRPADPRSFERARPSSVSRTLGILADRWTFLVLREMFFGIGRFDAFQARLGIATNILADRLARLTAQGIVRKAKYQDQPARFDYRLTAAGRDLYLPLIQMLRWGDRWLGSAPPILLTHLDCGEDFAPRLVCDHCREPLAPRDMRYRLNYTPPRQDRPPALVE